MVGRQLLAKIKGFSSPRASTEVILFVDGQGTCIAMKENRSLYQRDPATGRQIVDYKLFPFFIY